MNDIALNYLLDELKTLIKCFLELSAPTTLPKDKWIAASGLQKGVRRGNLQMTLRAFETLWGIDPLYARRRIGTIAFEEVGLGAPDIVGASIIACSGTKYLSKENIYPALKACALALAGSPKERSADHIYIAIADHDELDHLRNSYFEKSTQQLIDHMLDLEASLLERSMAAWFLAGTKRFWGGKIPSREGDMEAFEWAMEQLNIDPWHTLVTKAGIRVTQEALPIYWPIKLSQRDCLAGEVEWIDKTVQNDTRKVPPYLLDQFTRGGKAVIRKMLSNENELTSWLKGKLPSKAWQPTIEEGLFYVSSDILDQEYVFTGSDELRKLSIEADCSKSGLAVSDVQELMRILNKTIKDTTNMREGFIEKSGWT